MADPPHIADHPPTSPGNLTTDLAEAEARVQQLRRQIAALESQIERDKALMEEARDHLGAALIVSNDTDEQIIIDHIRAAHDHLKEIR